MTLLGGALYGIAVGILISLLWIVAKSSRPKAVVLACLPQSNVFRNSKRFPMAREVPGVRIFRFDGNLHFANKDYFTERVMKLDMKPTEDGTSIHTIVVDASSINQVDISATRNLILLAKEVNSKNIRLVFANWKARIIIYRFVTTSSRLPCLMLSLLCLPKMFRVLNVTFLRRPGSTIASPLKTCF